MRRLGLALILLSSACASAGYVRQAQPPVEEAKWVIAPRMKFVAQKNDTDCGWAVLDVLKHRWEAEHGSAPQAQPVVKTNKLTLTAGQLRQLLEGYGLRAFVVAGTYDDLVLEIREGRPVIVGTFRRKDDVVLGHYQVVAGVARSGDGLLLIDPARGWHTQSFAEFDKIWHLAKRVAIVAMPVNQD